MQRQPPRGLVTAIHDGVEAVHTAIEAGASVDERDDMGHTALMLACLAGRIDVAEALLDAGASPNRRTSDKEETVLHLLAARAEGAAALDLLLTRPVRAERRDRFGWTPLMVAARAGNTANVRVLLGACTDTGAKTPDGRTALDLARESGHGEVVALLS